MFVGAVSDNFDERIDQKIFHAEIVVDVAKVSAETKAYQPIPMIADFTNENGSDNLSETIETNYEPVKQEVLALVDSEVKRIMIRLLHISSKSKINLCLETIDCFSLLKCCISSF